MPFKFWIDSVAILGEKVYVTAKGSEFALAEPLMYDSNKDQWFSLPSLPFIDFSLVALPDRKQLLAIGGRTYKNGIPDCKITNKVFLWDEQNRKWTTPYPNMQTARCFCSGISHRSTVIVAGGITCWDPWTLTRAVEVLRIEEHFTNSHWRLVEQLPHAVGNAIPLIIDNNLYVTVGSDIKMGDNSCNIVTASLPELLQSSDKDTSSSQVWYKLPDIPYTSFAINHYRGRLITFSGCHKIEKPDENQPVWQSVPLIHMYNPYTKTWDCIGEVPYDYLLGRSFHVTDNKIYFIGGLTGTYYNNDDDNMVATCLMLTLSPD